MRDLLQDFRFALRQVRRKPAFAVASVLILGVGIGAATLIFSVLNPILFEPLPYPHANRILMIWDKYEGAHLDVAFHTYREVAERSRALEFVAVMRAWQPTVTGPAEPERLDGQSVSANYFRVLGIKPVLGRDFQDSDDQINAPKAVMLSNRLWQRVYGADPSIVGRQIRLNDDLYTVTGVMPATFENVLSPSAELWSPLRYDRSHSTEFETREWGHHLHMIGRLRQDVSVAQATSDLDAIAHTPTPQFPRAPWASLRSGFIADSLQADLTRGLKPALLAVVGAVGLLLLIACLNVANLLLARSIQRQSEFAVRAALGAERIRLVRQLVTESLMLSIAAGVFGIALANAGVRALAAFHPSDLPRLDAIRMDTAVFVFATTVAALIGLVLGIIPALQLSRGELHLRIQGASPRTATGHGWMRKTLVVAEVAIALVLLVGSGLLLHSLDRLFAVDPGFDPSHLLTMQVQTAGHRLDDDAAKRQFFEQVLEVVGHVSGVESAALTTLLPLSGDQYGTYGAQFEDKKGESVYRYVVTPGYFQTTSIRLVRGRLLTDQDVAGAQPVVLISESLAKRQFGGKDPIGARVRVGPPDRP